MKQVIDIIKGEKPSLSFEVFPPKTALSYESVSEAVTAIAQLLPSYISVTYGAGGGTSDYTEKIAEEILAKQVTPLAHLTCITAKKEDIKERLVALRQKGVKNILALRGDIPEGLVCGNDYRYAHELMKEIADFGGFCIGGACYPEAHPESENMQKDLDYLKIKAEHGCSFFTTQMFFDNHILYNFMYRLLKVGVDVPVVAGVMPVTNASQIKRICAISGTALPQKFLRIVDRYGDNPLAMRQAGIAYATEQIVDLYANGIDAVHVYSMNKPDIAKAIQNNLSDILA